MAAALLLCAIFFAIGYFFIPQAGVQEDEALFATGIFPPLVGREFVEIGGELYPVMIMTYAGALKALVYLGIFSIFSPDVLSLRIPMLVAGTVTVYLFFVFFRMIMGSLGALLATAVLVVDPLFITLTVLDSGISTIQHFLMAAALPLFVQYHRTRRIAWLAAACFLCGLALWDKATFIWVIAGWGAGLVAVYRPELRTHLAVRPVTVAAFCLLLGALPVVCYMLAESSTASSGTGGLAAPSAHKAVILMKTLDGSSVFGFLTRDPGPNTAPAPHTNVERASFWLSNASGHIWHHLLLWASILSALLIPLLKAGPGRRLMTFCVVAFAVGWAVMLPFAMGGGGSHHAILLWPLPQMLVAAAACSLGGLLPRFRRAIAAGLVAPVAVSCILVTNECYAQLTVFFGTPDHWSDASNPLLEWVLKTKPTSIYSLDWGIEGPLRYLGEGTLPLKDVSVLLSEALPQVGRRDRIRAMLERPRRIFIYYVDRSRHAPEKLEKLRDLAAQASLEEESMTEVHDRRNRPVYRVVRFVAAQSGSRE